MRFARFNAATAAILALSLLAACGGGGGGGSVTPPGGGNGGGGGPTPTPGVTATPTPGATATPTPVASATPTPVATATPTPGTTPTPPPSQTTVLTGYGEINGTDDQFHTSAQNAHDAGRGEGDLMPNDPGAVPQGGGQGAVVDNIPCEVSMPNNYHVHAFVGIMYNGTEIALPDGIGIVQPVGEFTDPATGAPNQELYASNCFYHLHTHDASGLVHLESNTPTCGAQATPQYSVVCSGSEFTLGNLIDIWGVSLTPANLGTFQGTVQVYSTPYNWSPCSPGPCYRPSNQYQLVADPAQWSSIPLYLHSVIWIVIGTQPARPADLPNIEWIGGGGNG